MADLDLDAIERVASRSVGFDHSAVICALVAEVRRLRAIEDAARAAYHSREWFGANPFMLALGDALEADR